MNPRDVKSRKADQYEAAMVEKREREAAERRAERSKRVRAEAARIRAEDDARLGPEHLKAREEWRAKNPEWAKVLDEFREVFPRARLVRIEPLTQDDIKARANRE